MTQIQKNYRKTLLISSRALKIKLTEQIFMNMINKVKMN